MSLMAITWDFNPVLFKIGSFEIAYYGLMWLLAFLIGERIFGRIVKREGLNENLTSSALFYMLIATMLGARFGHCLFYDFSYYILDPFQSTFPYVKVLDFRAGGLASHGAALGLVVGIFLWSRKWKMPSMWMFDRIGIVVAIGGACIRLGNLFNSEIYGTATDMPWGFIFVRRGETMAMHPTQIYEALMYLVTFAVLMHIYYRTKLSDKRGVMFGVFLIMLFGARLVIESIKNVQEAWELDMVASCGLNMGQVLSLPFILFGVGVLIYAFRRKANPYTNMPLAKGGKKK
ncbi:MAG: prolipoprotein diacylglyceryl transferase [Rikenellaceae bacterium]